MQNIKIRDIEVYHGSNILDNSYYIEHFKKQDKDIKHFFEDVMGRKKRYIVDSPNENSLTMAINVSKKVLEKSNLKGSDIDMIVYSSLFPEYAVPPCSVILHNAIKGKSSCFCQDINVNCLGMTYSLDMIYRYISCNDKVNKVLLIGSDFINLIANPNDELCYGQYGDAACAIIFEKTSDDCKLLGSEITINSECNNDFRFPKCGTSKIYDAKKEEIFAQCRVNIHDNSRLDKAIKNMNSLLKQNSLTIDDISMFCFSQLSCRPISYIREHMNIPEEKSIYIGDTYGYTGTSSPFIAFYEALKDQKIKRGDYVMFWTVGAGATQIALLVKY